MGSHLAGGRARPGGAGHPAPYRSAPRRRPPPRTPPGGHRAGVAPATPSTALGVRRAPHSTHLPGPPGLHIHTAQAPGGPSARANAERLLPAGLLHMDLQGACRRAASPVSVAGAARSGPAVGGLPRGLLRGPHGPGSRQPLTRVAEAQVVPEGQAGGLQQGAVLLRGQQGRVATGQALRAHVHHHVVTWGVAGSACQPPPLPSPPPPICSPPHPTPAGTLSCLRGVVSVGAP